MSLINEMLRDLEARRAGELTKTDLQREVRPLPPASRSLRFGQGIVIAFLLIALLVGGVAWWQPDVWRHESPSTGFAVRQDAVPVAAVQAVPPFAPLDQKTDAVTEALRLAVSLENPPVSVEEPVRWMESGDRRGQKAPAAIVSSVISDPPKTEGMPLKASEAAVAPQGAIEKSQVPGTPRERADSEFRRAQSFLASGGHTATVVEVLQGALRHDSGYGPARQLLVRVLLEGRHTDEAMAVLQEGLDVQPAQIGWALSLARLWVEKGDLSSAERVLARSRTYGENSPDYAGFHGHLLSRQGKFKESVELYQAATRAAPNDGRWWFGMGQALESGGRHEEALAAFRRALGTGNLNADLTALAEQRLR